MDVKETRLRNTRYLIQKHAGGNQKAFADQCELNANYLNQVLKGWQGRGMGPKNARQIERKLGKPRGWMDQPHTAEWREMENMTASIRHIPALTRLGSSIASRIESLQDERSIDQILALLDMLEEIERKKPAEPPDKATTKKT